MGCMFKQNGLYSRMTVGAVLLAAGAAVHGGRNRVMAALLAHPLVGQFDVASKLGRPADRREHAASPLGCGPVSSDLPAVLAIDGGNSKTDAALVAADGTLLAAVRGPGTTGAADLDATLAVLAGGPGCRSPGTCPAAWPTLTCRRKRSGWPRRSGCGDGATPLT